jgi:serine/threonine protein kinase/tetratricopeptide (TPR) repeat protein
VDERRADAGRSIAAASVAAARHSRISELFLHAVELDEPARSAWLMEACGDDASLRAEVEALLRRDATAAAVDRPVAGAVHLAALAPATMASSLGDSSHEISAGIPAQIGPFEVLGVLGRGGMGTVYRVRQRRPDRIVALKVMSGGWWSPALLRRFEFEVQFQARLQHPGIAQVYESGTAEVGGVAMPYFAMELVEGPRLTDFAAQRRLGLRERIELLAQVCDAVHHAHQRGVIHRDLKPGNIVVTASGQPKVLDFGVARVMDGDEAPATTAHTQTGELLGTRPYMSPEQVTGRSDEIDTRTDVYSLGVIAFELLSGRPPLEMPASVPAAVRRICEDEPPRLGTIARALRGDLETIVAKALEKAREQRYASVADFAADLRRYLNHEPIFARPASVTDQLVKFARRNRALVGGAALTAGALVLGIFGTTYGLLRARSERDAAVAARESEHEARRVAERQASIAQAVNELLLRMFDSADPLGDSGESTSELTVRALLERESARLDSALHDHPLVEASVRNTIGIAFKNLAQYDEAERHLRRALELFERFADSDPAHVARAERELGSLLVYRGDAQEGICYFERGLAREREISGPASLTTATAEARLAWSYVETGEVAQAEILLRRAMQSLEAGEPEQTCEALVGVYNNIARIHRFRGQNDDALTWYDEAAALLRARHGEFHPTMAAIYCNTGLIYAERKEFDEAERRYALAMRLREKAYGPDHPRVADIHANIAVLMAERGRPDEAIEHQQRALRIQEAALSPDHPDCLLARANLAAFLREAGHFEEAVQRWRDLVDTYARVYGPSHWRVDYGQCALARALIDCGRIEEAESIAPAAWERLVTKRPPPNPHTQTAAQILIRLYEGTGRMAEAEKIRTRAGLNP